ncbi:MAG TPA: GRP family sugar transporter [Bacteroidales bacterium]|nr:GRP family sugar transporter [Bacteroidales bacterium]
MFIVQNYSLAVVLCFITMFCWGSWGNTQKMAAKSWRYELFYWDYVLGILFFSLVLGFTLGSIGSEGRSFITDIRQVSSSNFWSAFGGGIIFNASNILLAAAISISGMSVAFPLGVGFALVLGVFINYFTAPRGNPYLLFIGVFAIVIAIIFNGMASGKMKKAGENSTANKGIWIAVSAGILMSLFYRLVAAAMDLTNLSSPAAGKATPYTAFFIFTLGILASNFLFNTIVMKKPFVGEPVRYSEYLRGSPATHLVGVLGGIIWGIGTSLSYLAAGKAGPAISYGLGQGATMVAAFWGVFVWKEFKGAARNINALLLLMFILFSGGLVLIIFSGAN